MMCARTNLRTTHMLDPKEDDDYMNKITAEWDIDWGSSSDSEEEEVYVVIMPPTLPRLPDEIWEMILRINREQDKGMKQRAYMAAFNARAIARTINGHLAHTVNRLIGTLTGTRDVSALRSWLHDYFKCINAPSVNLEEMARLYANVMNHCGQQSISVHRSLWEQLAVKHHQSDQLIRAFRDANDAHRKYMTWPRKRSIWVIRVCLQEATVKKGEVIHY